MKLVLPGIGVSPEAIDNSVGGLTLLAEQSGGLVTARTNDFDAAFGEIVADISSYYSLGYRVTGDLAGRRRIEVRMRDPRLTARARTSITARPPAAEPPEALLATLALPPLPEGSTPANELGISAVVAEGQSRARGALRVPIDILIPIDSLSFTEGRETFMAYITVHVAAADARKTLSEMKRFEHTIRIPRAEIENLAGTHYTYGLDLDLRTRTAENEIAVAVVDTTSGLTGYTVLKVGER